MAGQNHISEGNEFHDSVCGRQESDKEQIKEFLCPQFLCPKTPAPTNQKIRQRNWGQRNSMNDFDGLQDKRKCVRKNKNFSRERQA
jgi:hypothetical protein